MFRFPEIYRNDNGRLYKDYRYAFVDTRNPFGKRIMKLAKRVAMTTSDKEYNIAVAKLDEVLQPLNTDDLNVLSGMYMMVMPNTEAVATGKGAAWAVATRIVNERAMDMLKSRPMFELVE